ncbi:MAG TPA: sigma-70 family RNA polymerase sigma factor [Burkholderiales bacterium]|nr:sigma-70 family RNA polymerase sigma factor [Burkholderiales bacterium]
MPVKAATSDPLELERHRPYLMRFALLQLRERSVAEDAVQEALLAAVQGAERFAGQSSVRTWLIGILKHKIIDHIRKAARERAIEPPESEGGTEDLEAFFGSDGHFMEPPGEWASPERALEERRFFEALERCLRTLPKNTAHAFMMRELDGLGTEEICKELGISPSNCWVMLYRARMSLRACLERTWFLAGAAGSG